METRVYTKSGPPAQPIENFGWKNRLLGRRHTVCKTCTAKRSSNWYYENQDRQKENVRRNNQDYREIAREYVWEYLSTHPCSNPDCHGGPNGGPENDPSALEFHHLGGKEAEIGRLIGRGASLDTV